MNKLIAINTHRISNTHLRAEIEIRGRVFAATYACAPGAEPSQEELRRDYRNDRAAWLPFDQSVGAFLGKGGTK